jgi:hypothetical protein
MATSLLAHDDFWEAITEEMCKAIEESPSEFNDAGWVSRAFGEDHKNGEPMLAQPSAGQAAEDARYAKHLQFSVEAASRMLVVEPSLTKTVGSSEDLIEEHTGTSPLPHITPVTDKVMTNPASSTTADLASNIDNVEILISLNAVSPTPAANLFPVGGEEVASQPSQNSDVERKVNRKLSFGLSDFGAGQLLMPPPNVRRTSVGSEDDLFAHFIHTDACAPAGSEVSCLDIPTSHSQDQLASPSGNVQLNQKPPKTPVLADFGSPSSSIVIRDNTNHSYPTCIDGMGLEIPLHHLEFLRKAVDPTFQNDEWGDGMYFLDEPVYSSYSNSSELYGFRRKDWSIIFHALDNGSDRQFPLPNTKTQPLFTDKQVYRIAYGPTHIDQHKAMARATLERIHTHKQKDEAGLMWTQILGSYHSEPPEFAMTSTEKMCASPHFKTFCKFASSFEGRHLEKPDLDDARAVLRYAQFPKLPLNPPRIDVDQQVHHGSQHLTPANTALLPDTVDPPGLQLQSSPLSAPVSTPLQELYQQPPQQPLPQPVPQQLEQMIQTIRPNPTLMKDAYNNFNVFRALPFPLLSRFHTQYIQARALHYGRLGQPIPNAAPTYRNMWQAFRRDVEASRAAAQTRQTRTMVPGVPPPEVQAARETAIRQAQARMAQNLVGAGAGTLVLSRPVQLQSHMPTRPLGIEEDQQAKGSGRMMASATELGSPFMTPRPRGGDD